MQFQQDNPLIPNWAEKPMNAGLDWMGFQVGNPMAGVQPSPATYGYSSSAMDATGQAIQNGMGAGNNPAAGNSWFSKDSMFGSVGTNGVATQGWFAPVAQAGAGLVNSWLAMKQVDQAKKDFALNQEKFGFQKEAFNRNFAMQAKTINTAMADRQKARLAANPSGYQSVGDYMKDNKVG